MKNNKNIPVNSFEIMLLALKEEFPVVVLCTYKDASIRICLCMCLYEENLIFICSNACNAKCVEILRNHGSLCVQQQNLFLFLQFIHVFVCMYICPRILPQVKLFKISSTQNFKYKSCIGMKSCNSIRIFLFFFLFFKLKIYFQFMGYTNTSASKDLSLSIKYCIFEKFV